MEEIRLVSKITVGSKNPNQSIHRVELTPWDLYFLLFGPIQKGLLFPKPKPSSPTNTVDHLKNSLSRTLDFFPPLAGRLASTKHEDNAATTFFIDCNNSGALFVHAVANNIAIHDILEPVYVPRVLHSFFPLNGVLNYEGVSQPVLGIQVTELADGLFIGCAMNHTVVDGLSFWNFFNSWSEIARCPDNSIISRPPPFLNRWFPDNIDHDQIHHPIRIPLFEAQLGSTASNIPPQLQERVFHFTRERISGLKTKANSEMGTTRISSLQALLSHVWRAVVRCRGTDAKQETMFKLGIDARLRLKPPLPGDYFGNAVQFKAVTSISGEVIERGLGWCAWEMNKFIALQTDDEIRKHLKGWEENPKIAKLGGHFNCLITSSSPRFDVCGNDFGWGKPVAVTSGAENKFDGKLTVFPGMEEGSIDVEVCLAPRTLEAMAADAEFVEAVA